jgi:hypothetical protein
MILVAISSLALSAISWIPRLEVSYNQLLFFSSSNVIRADMPSTTYFMQPTYFIPEIWLCAFLGFILFLKYSNSMKNKVFSISLLLPTFLLSIGHLLGTPLFSQRFMFYLNLFSPIFAAFFLINLFKHVKTKKIFSILLIFLFVTSLVTSSSSYAQTRKSHLYRDGKDAAKFIINETNQDDLIFTTPQAAYNLLYLTNCDVIWANNQFQPISKDKLFLKRAEDAIKIMKLTDMNETIKILTKYDDKWEGGIFIYLPKDSSVYTRHEGLLPIDYNRFEKNPYFKRIFENRRVRIYKFNPSQ